MLELRYRTHGFHGAVTDAIEAVHHAVAAELSLDDHDYELHVWHAVGCNGRDRLKQAMRDGASMKQRGNFHSYFVQRCEMNTWQAR